MVAANRDGEEWGTPEQAFSQDQKRGSMGKKYFEVKKWKTILGSRSLGNNNYYRSKVKEALEMSIKTITPMMITEFRNKLIMEERSETTVRKYVHDIGVLDMFVGTRPLNKEQMILFKKHLMERYAPSSVNSMLAAVNCFLKGIGRHDCTVKALKIQRQAFRTKEKEMTKAEYYRLLDAAKRRKDTRLYLLMQTICSTGIRVSELPFITVESVKCGSTVVSLKGKSRQILIPAALRKELKKYANEKGIRNGSIFITKSGRSMDRSNILHAMKALCADARVNAQKVFPHNFRHLFACLYYKATKDISRLADLLGHSSVNTTRIYTSTNGTEQARLIDRLGLVV